MPLRLKVTVCPAVTLAVVPLNTCELPTSALFKTLSPAKVASVRVGSGFEPPGCPGSPPLLLLPPPPPPPLLAAMAMPAPNATTPSTAPRMAGSKLEPSRSSAPTSGTVS